MLRESARGVLPASQLDPGDLGIVKWFTLLIIFLMSGVSYASTENLLTLAWNPVEDIRVAHYELHYGKASKSYSTHVSSVDASVIVAGLEEGAQYYFAARACTSDGTQCSEFSNEVTASIPGGDSNLGGTLAPTNSSVNLSAEGGVDWVHWGRSTSADVSRKAGVATQIGALTSIDGTRFGRFSNTSRPAYTWSDGTPTASATTNAGLVLSGAGRGYALTVPAGTEARTLVVYVGGWKSDARLDVSLSDGSAAPYSVTVSHLDSLRDDYDARLVVTYQAASNGQTLNLRYVQTSSIGTVNFMAASLQGVSLARTVQAEADASKPAIEIGEVEINQEWQRVDFQRTFNDPIVVAKALSANDSDPAVVRIDGIDSKGFWIRVQEWDYLDGWHDLETVSYIAMERGRHTLESGVQIEAGSVTTAVTNAFQGQLFEAPFADVPVVFTAITSANGPEAAISRLGNIGVDGFDIGLATEAASVSEHTAERIDYIAWEVSTGVVDGLRYEVGRTGKDVDHRTYNVLYQNVFAQAPVIVADVQSSDGKGTAALRWQNLNIESVDLWIQAEESLGDVTPQVAEEVGYFFADVE